MKKYNVSLISYLNSRPFLYGLENSAVNKEINISLDVPSRTADKIATGNTDIGLVPVGALSGLPEYRLAGDYCIGAYGPVRTVVMASNVPLENVDTILLDYQSCSSVLLTRVLASFSWKMEFNWQNSTPGYEKEAIRGKTAGVVIGDRVFNVEKMYPYVYDLSSEWLKFSGLPFVFAVWVTMRHLPSWFLRLFNSAIEYGIASIPEVEKQVRQFYPDVDFYTYFTKNISYVLDDKKREGMRLFLELAQKVEKGNRNW